jgi:hypothetical protein
MAKKENKKYFAVSDTHGFFDAMIGSLKEAGFDEADPTHNLIVLGDLFDRGRQDMEIWDWVKAFPKRRLTLIRGNHEYLMREMIERKSPVSVDYSNGTFDSLSQISGVNDFEMSSNPGVFAAACESDKAKEWMGWVFGRRSPWKDFLELGDYVFVHCWVPVDNLDGIDMYYYRNRRLARKADWHIATPKEWEDATWGCPYALDEAGLAPDGKTIVCGHWSAFDLWKMKDAEHGLSDAERRNAEDSPYFGKSVIGIDGCTALNGRCLVAVFDWDGSKLTLEKPLPPGK